MLCLSWHALTCAVCAGAASHVDHRRMVQVGEEVDLADAEVDLPRGGRLGQLRPNEQPLASARERQQQAAATDVGPRRRAPSIKFASAPSVRNELCHL